MSAYNDAGLRTAAQQAVNDNHETKQIAQNWIDYAHKLEDNVLELSSKLTAAYSLMEAMAAGTVPASANLRTMLEEAAQKSRDALNLAHSKNVSSAPTGKKITTKKKVIADACMPNSPNFSGRKAFDAVVSGKPLQGNFDDMHEMVIELSAELIASNNLVLRLLAEGNGQSVPEPLLPAGNYDARREFLESRAKNSREGMIDYGLQEIKESVGEILGNQQIKIVKKIITPISTPVRPARVQ